MSKFCILAGWDDVPHLTEKDKAELLGEIPVYMRDARTRGIPSLGSGRIFPIPEEEIACDPVRVSKYWPQIGAMDFGWDHPFAAVRLAWDPEGDVVYVTQCYRIREQSPAMVSIALKPWGSWLPWAWPRDGHRETQEGAGLALAKQFKAHGLNMLGTHAKFPDGSVSVEAGLMDMLDRMQTGRFKVFRHLNDWFEEFRLYHRKDGRVVKEHDDLMAATRYGVMMLREALIEPSARPEGRRKAEFSDPLEMFR